MVFSCCPDWEFVEPQSFSFSKKRAHCCTATQEEMRYESTQVKAPPSIKKNKNEAAHSHCKIRMIPVERSRRASSLKIRCGAREKEQSLQERNGTWKKTRSHEGGH